MYNEIMMKSLGDTTYILPTLIGAICFALGSVFFFIQWPYSESGHEIVFAIYSLFCMISIFTIRKKKIILSLCVFMILGASIYYSCEKFQWRKDYITSSQTGDFFLLDPYIEEYPLYEDRVFSAFLNNPKYVAFSDECYKPALNNQTPASNCKSLNLIKSHYNVDVNQMIQDHYTKMQSTARQFEGGRIKDRRQYQNCLKTKRCAKIPLLPAGADIASINPESHDYIDIRRQFWSLLDGNKKITPDICEFMDLCRTMRDINIISIAKP